MPCWRQFGRWRARKTTIVHALLGAAFLGLVLNFSQVVKAAPMLDDDLDESAEGINVEDEMSSELDGGRGSARFRDAGVGGQPYYTEVNFLNFHDVVKVTPPTSGLCTKQTKIVIMVLSRPENFAMRRRIRESWAKNLPKSVRMMFIFGRPWNETIPGARFWWENPSALGKNLEKIVDGIAQENTYYGDSVMTDNIDQYGKNLTLKVILGLRFIRDHCPTARWIVKIDEDSVIIVRRMKFWIRHRLEKFAQGSPGHKAVFGSMFQEGDPPFRDETHKWHLPPNEFPGDRYPAYMTGATYIMTREALREIVDDERTKKFNLMRLEDVTITGVLATDADAPRIETRDYIRSFDKLKPVEKCTRPNSKGRLKKRRAVPHIFTLTIGSSKNPERTFHMLKSIKCNDRKQ